MAYCKNCGVPIEPHTVICPSCGATQQVQQTNSMYQQPNSVYQQPNTYQQPYNNMYSTKSSKHDSGSFGWALLGFFFPLVGFTLFLLWHKTRPASAKRAFSGALFRMIVWAIIYIRAFIGSSSGYAY